ncbi:MAG: excalibur calcium-binding domain-containing protein [Pseudomonadales bacterium]
MSTIVFLIGIIIFIIGGLGYLIAAFKTSILWGLGVLFLPFISLFYLIIHWQSAKKPFLTQVFGLALIIGSALLQDNIAFPITNKLTSYTSNFSSTIQKTIAPPTTSNTTSVYTTSTQTTQSSFRCDGRQYCSQMTSRAEAEFFVKNCPNTKMDGDNDGHPCENDSRF